MRALALIALLLVSFSSVFAQIDTIAIIDAGSSGSRLYVYQVNTSVGTVSCIYPVTPTQSANSKGRKLSGITNNKDSVETFLNDMTGKYSTKGKQKDLYVLATAGMRVVEKTKANSIYNFMKNKTSNNYKVKNAMTISGRYEGLYAWIAVNYDKGNIGTSISTSQKPLTYTSDHTCGIIEIGGASMQITFAVPQRFYSTYSDACISRKGFSGIYSKSYLSGGVDMIYKKYGEPQRKEPDSSKLNYYYSSDNYATLNSDIGKKLPAKEIKENVSFCGLGKAIGFVIDGVKSKGIVKYINALKPGDKFHPLSNALYIKWLTEKLEIEITSIEKKEDVSWTKGAALDIVINRENPESFNYVTNNPN